MFVSALTCAKHFNLCQELIPTREHNRLYSLGWEDVGVVLKLDEWMVVVGVADKVGLPLTEDGLKVVKSDGDRLNEIGTDSTYMFLVFCKCALTCVEHFNLCQGKRSN